MLVANFVQKIKSLKKEKNKRGKQIYFLSKKSGFYLLHLEQ